MSWVPIGGDVTWGSITGTLSNQTDLNTALGNKQNKVYKQTTEPTTAVAGDLWCLVGGPGTGDGYIVSGTVTGNTLSLANSDGTTTNFTPAYTKTDVGLGNCDNTADIDKPISTAVQTALNNKSTVTVATSGTSTSTVYYITIDGVEKKLPSGGSGSVDLEQIGVVKAYPHGATVTGWVKCNGAFVARAGTYMELFNAVGVQFTTPWASGVIYAIDAYVKNDNKLYKCIESHTSGESFDPTKWQEDTTNFQLPNIADTDFDHFIRYAHTATQDTVFYDSNPVGFVSWFAGTSIPNGYLECDGALKNRTAYADLYAVIGFTWTPEFSASKTYALDDYCVHDNKLYKCTTAITTAAAWDASKWTEDTVNFQLPNLADRYLKGSGTASVGDYIEAGLPMPTIATAGTHSHTKGTMNITGSFQTDLVNRGDQSPSGAFSKSTNSIWRSTTEMNDNIGTNYAFDAASSWTGNTSSDGSHTHTVTEDSIYKSTNITVNPDAAVGKWCIKFAKTSGGGAGGSGVKVYETLPAISEVADDEIFAVPEASMVAQVWLLDKPVGARYIQLEGMSNPNDIAGIWELDSTYNGQAIWCDNTQALGTALAGSLPKIEGTAPLTAVDARFNSNATGAFDSTGIVQGSGTYAYGGGDYSIKGYKVPFNASNSNAIYSATAGANVVRPTSKTCKVWKRIG